MSNRACGEVLHRLERRFGPLEAEVISSPVGGPPRMSPRKMLNAYNEANLARYTAKHLRKEAASDQVAIAQSNRNMHLSIGGIILGSLFTVGYYLPFMLGLYLLGLPFTIGNRKPFFRYKAELLFDTAEQHFVVLEPRSGLNTPILLIPARGAHAYWHPDRGSGDDFQAAYGALNYGKLVFKDLDQVGANKARQWIP